MTVLTANILTEDGSLLTDEAGSYLIADGYSTGATLTSNVTSPSRSDILSQSIPSSTVYGDPRSNTVYAN